MTEGILAWLDENRRTKFFRDPVCAQRLRSSSAWLDENRRTKFFLWAHYFDPHFNYNPPPEVEGVFGYARERCGRAVNGLDITELKEIEKTLTRGEVQCLVDLYDAEVLATDEWIGRLVDRIDELGLGGQTVLVVTADHGEEFMEKGRIGHEKNLYQPTLRVPLVVRVPRMGSARRVKADFSTVDVFSLVLGIVTGSRFEPSEDPIARTFHYYRGTSRPNEFSIVSGDFKYIATPERGREEFYDLGSDPGERRSLADSRKKEDLAARLGRWMDENRADALAPSEEALRQDEETTEKLKTLGYVD